MDMNFIPLLVVLPIAIYIFAKQDFAKVFFYKMRILSITLILILLSPMALSGSLIPDASADNTIRQLIKIVDTYPADVASADFVINPPLLNIDKTFVFWTVSHTGEEDHSDTFKSVEIVDTQTLRIKGEDTASGNLALDFVVYVIEYDADSALDVQHLQGTITDTSTGTETFTMGSVNTTNSMLIPRGHHHNASETTVGDEEYTRLRIVDSTTWEHFVANSINSGPQGEAVSILDWNQSDIRVLRDQGTFVAEGGDQTVIETPASFVDWTRSILMVTYANDEGASIDSDDASVAASLTQDGNIVFHRGDAEGDVFWSYEIIEFPADFIRVTHFNTTLADTDLTTTVTTPDVRDFDKTIAISTVASPFGFSTGAHDETDELPGAIDRVQATFQVTSNNEVLISRDDSSGEMDVRWQLIEFYEPEFAEKTHGTNFLEQVIKLEGDFTAGNVFQDFTITPALTNINKTMVFVTMNSTFQDGSSENGKLWEIIDENTFRIVGSGDAINDAAHFNAVFVEMNGTSPIFVQFDQLNFPGGTTNVNKTQWISPVNTTSSFIVGQGSIMKDGDPTFGFEEFARITLDNETAWRYETEIEQNQGIETTYRSMITDFNDDDVLVQRGIGTLTTLTDTITPPIAIEHDETLLFVSFKTVNGVFGEFPDRSSLMATINRTSNDIFLQRNSSAVVDLDYAWQTISFLADQVRIQHGIHKQFDGESNMTEFIPPFGSSVINASKAFAIGTVGEYYTQSMGSCSSTVANNFDCAFGHMQLENGSSLRLIRGSDTGEWIMGFQVSEFLFGSDSTTNIEEVTDDVNVTDTVSTSLGIFQTLDSTNNNVNVTDTISLILGFNQTLDTANNNVNVTDTVSTSLVATQTLDSTNNNVNVTDTVSTSVGIFQTLDSANNNVNVTDTVSTSVGIFQTLDSATNNVNVTDTVSTVLGAVQTLDSANNNVNVTDSVVITAGFNEIIGSGANNVNVTDTVSLILGANQTLDSANNNVNVTDTVSTSVGISQTIDSANNNVNVTDTIALTAAFSQIINDIILVNDTVTVVNATLPPVTPPGGGGGPATTAPPSGGGGGVPSPPTSSGSLTGIQISEPEHTVSSEIIVNPFFLDRIDSGEIELNWDQLEPIQIRQIEIPIQYEGFIDFKKEGSFEFSGTANEGENFATGIIEYEVTIPPLALGIGPDTNTLGDSVEFFDYWMLVLFNEYTIPVTISAVHNNIEFPIQTEITVTHLKEVRWIVIALTIAGGAWLAVWGARAFRNPSVKTGTFKKGLDKARSSTIEKRKPGTFRRELERQRNADRNNIKKIKRKQR